MLPRANPHAGEVDGNALKQRVGALDFADHRALVAGWAAGQERE
jgi:hypothetical protein